jgi:hypothetical protein
MPRRGTPEQIAFALAKGGCKSGKCRPRNSTTKGTV